MGWRRSEPGGRDQDRSPQFVATHDIDPRGRAPCSPYRGMERRTRRHPFSGISGRSNEFADAWASWSSEIAADAFAFVHTGFASVAALRNILAGDLPMVFRYTQGDPHPVSYIRVLLGVEICPIFLLRWSVG